MKKHFVFSTISLALMFSGFLYAANPQIVTVNATVAETLTLTISATVISFPDADPDVTPSIPSSPASVTVTAKAKTGSAKTVTLTATAPAALTSPTDTISITNVTWTVTGAGFVPGTLGDSVTVASWTGSGNRSGTLSYFLANSWTYATGAYTTTVTYTLAAI